MILFLIGSALVMIAHAIQYVELWEVTRRHHAAEVAWAGFVSAGTVAIATSIITYSWPRLIEW